MRRCEVLYLGRIGYSEAMVLQDAIARRLKDGGGDAGERLLLLEHPPVITLGRNAEEADVVAAAETLRALGVSVERTDRGGQVTYHGPGQLVGYPILDLRRVGLSIPAYLERLEQSLIAYLAELGIASEAGAPGLTGVWSDGMKLAAIGIKLNRSVVSHGFALNLTTDLDYFTGIVPCGHAELRPTSVEALTGVRIQSEDAARAYAAQFANVFQVDVDWVESPSLRSIGPAA